jgi:Derlin-2/3
MCLLVATLVLSLVTVNATPLTTRSLAHHGSKQLPWTTTRLSKYYDTTTTSRLLLSVRGGSDEEEAEEDEYDEEDISEDDDEGFFDDFELGEDVEDDFAEDNTVDRIITAFQKTPPLTKGYLTASFVATAAGYVLNNNVFPPSLVLDWKKVISRAQIWRPFSTFLNFGPFGLGYVMTVHFVWTYMGTLERLHHHKPYDFWIMIVFGMLTMVVGYPFLKLSPRFLGHNLSTFLVYIWSRYHEGLEVNMFELFNTRAELLPWFFLAQVRTSTGLYAHWQAASSNKKKYHFE